MSGNSSLNPKNVDVIKGIQLLAEPNQSKASPRYIREYLLDNWAFHLAQSRSRNHTYRPGIRRHQHASKQR